MDFFHCFKQQQQKQPQQKQKQVNDAKGGKPNKDKEDAPGKPLFKPKKNKIKNKNKNKN